MKKSKDYLQNVNSLTTREELYEIGRQMQEDAIKETVKKCANSATVTYDDYDDFVNGKATYIVNKKSILSVANKLIQEL